MSRLSNFSKSFSLVSKWATHSSTRSRYISSTRQQPDSPGDKATPNANSGLTKDRQNSSSSKPNRPERTKSVAEADQELRERLELMSGGGGASGIEYEDGKLQAMKRSVRNNMFRYI